MSLFSRLRTEVTHYQNLSLEARRLFLSSTLYELTNPLSFLFTNAFLFRSSDPSLVALYDLGMFIALPFAFFFNGWLLRHFKINHLFSVGVILQGLVGLVIFFLPELGAREIFLFGAAFGFPLGIYWANRNYLALVTTTDEQRVYYGGLEQVMSTGVEISMPVIIGAVISIAANTHMYSVTWSYRAFAFISLLFYVGCAWTLSQVKLKNPSIRKIMLFRSSGEWWKIRFLEIFLGIQNGLNFFIPSLITLSFLGKEGTLGALSAAAAVAGAIAVYALSRTTGSHQRGRRFLFITVLQILLALAFTIFFTPLTAILLLVFMQPLLQLAWPLQQAEVSRILDKEGAEHSYAYVADEELFLNVGRILGVAIFYGVSLFLLPGTILRVLPTVAPTTQIVVALILFWLVSSKKITNKS